MVTELAKEHYVVIFDNRGVGQTTDSGEPFTVETMADDAMALAEALKLNRPSIAGHSLGGAITQMIAKKYSHKIHKITLCNTFIKFNKASENAFRHVVTLYQHGASQADIMDWVIPCVFSRSFVTPELTDMIRKFSNENPHPQLLNDYQRQLEALINFDSSAWISSLPLPHQNILVIGSEEDITATLDESKELVAHLIGSKLGILAGAHASAVEQPEPFLKLLQPFFKEGI
jgi:pimeloyl-ACP methyl ester carboxylesterase